eukprot:scaffold214481_cov68-Cyclotella_meneghiniana.AAC.1
MAETLVTERSTRPSSALTIWRQSTPVGGSQRISINVAKPAPYALPSASQFASLSPSGVEGDVPWTQIV